MSIPRWEMIRPMSKGKAKPTAKLMHPPVPLRSLHHERGKMMQNMLKCGKLQLGNVWKQPCSVQQVRPCE